MITTGLARAASATPAVRGSTLAGEAALSTCGDLMLSYVSSATSVTSITTVIDAAAASTRRT
ncbi:hypothetical protein F2P46_33995 [Massilia sp. CCM 8734]|nr:hypothetical protein [Massilia sp. CCM 8734]